MSRRGVSRLPRFSTYRRMGGRRLCKKELRASTEYEAGTAGSQFLQPSTSPIPRLTQNGMIFLIPFFFFFLLLESSESLARLELASAPAAAALPAGPCWISFTCAGGGNGC